VVVEWGEEASHVEGEVSHGEIIGYGVDGSQVNAFRSRIRSYVCPNLFQQVENLSATKICRRSPFLGSRTAEKDLSEKVVVYTIPAETMAALILRKLNGQIGIPDFLP
jgi:hypothetical protein